MIEDSVYVKKNDIWDHPPPPKKKRDTTLKNQSKTNKNSLKKEIVH